MAKRERPKHGRFYDTPTWQQKKQDKALCSTIKGILLLPLTLAKHSSKRHKRTKQHYAVDKQSINLSLVIVLILLITIPTIFIVSVNLKTDGVFTYEKNADDSCTVDSVRDSNATTLVIPEEFRGKPVTGIGTYAFSKCKSLTNITIPDSVITIDGWAFAGCSSLVDIVIPTSVTSIGKSAFYDCTNLTSATFEDPNGWYGQSFNYTTPNCLILTDPTQNAISLKGIYCNYDLCKKN